MSSWEDFDGIKNCDVGPCEVFIDKQFLGPTSESVVLELPFDSFPVEYGIPATSMGDIVTRINGTLNVSCLFSKPEIIALCGGTIHEEDPEGPYMTSGTEILMPTVKNVVLHHENKLNGKHLIIGIWKMQSTAPIRWDFLSANPSKVMTVDLSFKLLASDDEVWRKKSPLCVVYWRDSFDINNLPWEQPGPGPEPPGPDSHVISNEAVNISGHVGTLAHSKVSNYTFKDSSGANTLTEGTDFEFNSNTGGITLLEGGSYYNATKLKANYTWWDNRTQVTGEQSTSIDAGGGNYRYDLAHSPLENSGLVVTDSTGTTEYIQGTDYTCNYDSGNLFALADSPMLAANFEILANYFYYSNNE